MRLCLKHFWVILLIIFFVWSNQVFAAESPILISPSDQALEDKSPKLVWEFRGECVEKGSCFRVELDNNPDFSSPEKSVYTNSFSYSPQGLPNGTWNWRVKAKDKTDTWSEWSQIFKFSIGTNLSTPTPTPQTAPGSPTPNPSISKSENIFSIKNAPGNINSDQDFEIEVLVNLPDKANTRFYLKGAFKKSDSSNYFGENFIGGSWVRNNSSYSSQFKIETNKDGRWEGRIKVRPDAEDSGFDGTGDYIFKVGRYTDTGSGPSWSNELSLKIDEVNKPEPSPSEEVEIIEFEEEEIDFSDSIVANAAPSRNYEFKIASVAGEATMSNNITLEEHARVLEEKKVNWLLILLGGGILAGGIGFTLYKIRKDEKN